jgi:hypothetical protein
MGQGVVLQTAVAVAEVLLQGVPPFCAGVVMAYAEVLNPLPQLLEHALGACQLPTQLMAQGWVLQYAVTAKPVLKGQVFPPYWAGVVMT